MEEEPRGLRGEGVGIGAGAGAGGGAGAGAGGGDGAGAGAAGAGAGGGAQPSGPHTLAVVAGLQVALIASSTLARSPSCPMPACLSRPSIDLLSLAASNSMISPDAASTAAMVESSRPSVASACCNGDGGISSPPDSKYAVSDSRLHFLIASVISRSSANYEARSS